MGAIFRSWWQQIKQHRANIEVAGIIFVVVIALIIIGYWFDWTGFNGYNKVTTTHIISGTNAGTVTRTEEYQPGKGLWDWLQLLSVLAIPVVVGFGAVWFTTRQSKVADAENKDNQRETALQAYIDSISELLLHENLGTSNYDDKVRHIARTRTLSVLRSLNKVRKVILLMFLYESDLIVTYQGRCILDMEGADLSGIELRKVHLKHVDLIGANLSEANLSEANLSASTLRNANLSNADLSEAVLDLVIGPVIDGNVVVKEVDLTRANLSGANLSNVKMRDVILKEANLTGANLKGAMIITYNKNNDMDITGRRMTREELEKQTTLLKGATMPDGSKHP